MGRSVEQPLTPPSRVATANSATMSRVGGINGRPSSCQRTPASGLIGS
ncbi:hypothetical protein I551_1153 [Mycobacterium ulcerans str. Harvey]|uniref:Uncharacterized protein n=1 Tax=Mycobacterium ulcerans str. Harvey TaxID=1299332 RepID=A0ABN0R5L7_MYCUL|nr:hypothetical protein I551_1153 [Mycobacterium ulcerans str. Harvey]